MLKVVVVQKTDSDGKLSLAYVQQKIPDFSGLCYRLQDGSKTHLKADSNGYLVPPEDGWGARDYFAEFGLDNGYASDGDMNEKEWVVSNGSKRGEKGSFSSNGERVPEQPQTHDELCLRIQELNEQLNSVIAQKQSALDQVARTDDELRALRSEKSEAESRIGDLETQLRRMCQEKDEIAGNRDEAWQNFHRTQQILDDVRREKEEIARNRDEGWNNFRMAEEQLRNVYREVDEIAGNRDEAWRRVHELERDLGQLQIERDDIAWNRGQGWQRVHELEGELGHLRKERDDIAWNRGELQAEVGRLRCDRDSIASDRDEGWRRCHIAEGELENWNRQSGGNAQEAWNRVHHLEHELHCVHCDRDTIAANRDEGWRRCHAAEGELAHIRNSGGDHTEAWNRVRWLESELGRVHQEKIDIAQNRDEGWSRFHGLQAEFDRTKAERDEIARNRDEGWSRAHAAESELAAFKKCDTIKDNLEFTLSKISDHESKSPSSKLKSSHFPFDESGGDEVAKLKNKVSELRQRLDAYKRRTTDFEGASVSQLQTSLIEARDELEQAWQRAEVAEVELRYLRNQYTELCLRCNIVPSDPNLRQMQAVQRAETLESDLNRTRHQFEEAARKCAMLENRLRNELGDCFIVRKMPLKDRHKWKFDGAEYRFPVTFEVSQDAVEPIGKPFIFVAGSFYNWEVFIPLYLQPDGRYRTWLELPAGHHEFKFYWNDEWHKSDQYEQCWDGHNGQNNFVRVNLP